MEYKITNKKTGSVEIMNHKQIVDRIMTCKGKFYEMYTKEHISETPIQDTLNEIKFCWLDIIMSVCLTSVVILTIFKYFV